MPILKGGRIKGHVGFEDILIEIEEEGLRLKEDCKEGDNIFLFWDEWKRLKNYIEQIKNSA